MNFASSIYSKLEPRIEDEIGRTTTTEGRWFFVSETRPIIRDVLFSRGKTRALFDIRWVASGGTRRRAKRRRSFSDLGINCKLVYRPQRTLGCWFIRRVVAAFASSSPSSLRSPFNSGSPVPSRPVPRIPAPGQRRNLPSRMEIAGNFIGFFPDSRLLSNLL